MVNSYLPIAPEYFEMLEKESNKDILKVFYFGFDNYPHLEEASGKVSRIDKDINNAFYLYFEDNQQVRLDRIVVFNGIPGPAYDEYDAFALAPLTCKAGYDDEDDC